VNQRIVVVSATVTGDTIPPVLKMDGKPRDTTAVGVRYTDPGATATDIGPGGATTNLNASIVRTVTNASSATVQFDQFYKTIGSYSITYSVKDAAGNPAKDVSRSVYVKDTSATPPDSLFARYGVPLTSALATINHTFKDTPFVVDGPAALVPKMKSVKEFVLNWDLTNKQVNQFSLGLTSGSFMNFTVGGSTNKLTHTFAGDKPTFSITGSGISKLDGEYYIVATTKQCVWVRTDGSFAIIFK
jgi:hypothetical protein